ncbi:hypothetical protein CC2G_006536 [Coprinopsis cinerea AmutBmut pab1-1]|nr:hypothetical protein CC2G_006536 [Coprinopsis cinerea AmutBmut pab1-1]
MPSVVSVFEDSSPYFSYLGEGWGPGTSDSDPFLSNYTEHSFMGTERLGSSMVFQFYGVAVSIYGSRRPNHGRYQAIVDGEEYPEGNGLTPPGEREFNATLFERFGLEQGTHEVEFINREGAWLDVDAVSWVVNIGEENEPLIVNMVQDSHPSWVYQPAGAWTTIPTGVGSFSGRSGHGTSEMGASAELTFKVGELYPAY